MIGEAAALGAALCWAVGSHLWGRIGRGIDVAPGALNLGKCATATVYFGVTGLVLRGRLLPDLSGRALGLLALSGFVGLTLGDGAYFGAMAILGVRRALLLLSTAPVFTALGGALWLGEPVRPLDLAAIAVVLAGVALVVNEQPERAVAPRGAGGAGAAAIVAKGSALWGVLLGVGAGVGQAAGSLISRSAMRAGATPLDTALVRLPAGLAGIVILAGVTGRLWGWTRPLARPRLLGSIAGAAFVGTYLGLWLAQLGIGEASSAAVASTLLATSPLFALPLGFWLNGERISARALAGTVLACSGLAGLTLTKS
jgi:drug/metabolite transporter (DMT)-like permease